jgi:hypothetical protein
MSTDLLDLASTTWVVKPFNGAHSPYIEYSRKFPPIPRKRSGVASTFRRYFARTDGERIVQLNLAQDLAKWVTPLLFHPQAFSSSSQPSPPHTAASRPLAWATQAHTAASFAGTGHTAGRLAQAFAILPHTIASCPCALRILAHTVRSGRDCAFDLASALFSQRQLSICCSCSRCRVSHL